MPFSLSLFSLSSTCITYIFFFIQPKKTNMYSSSTSSSPQGSMGSTGGGGGGLMRYGSAPGSLLTSAVDSVIGATREFSVLGSQNHLGPTARFLPSESVTMANQTREETTKDNATIGLQPSYGFGGGVPSSSSSLARHSSSPAGFFNQLASAAADNNGAGFCITRGIGNYNSKGMCESRLNPQLSFTGGRETENADHQTKSSSRSYTGGSFGSSWDQNHPINFSVAPPNGANNSKNMDYSQFEFSMSSQEMGNNNIPEDSTPCKIRAKRGFATHPRSIAERERRTKISGKLKKLQDLVPNMDKQTSYADMLDLAVKHIKALQNQVQNLHNELESCTCGCKKPRDS